MNIIEEITKKYNGNYSEEFTKQTNTISGKYTFQPKRGVIDVDGTKISINLNEVGGASPITEPIRIILHLNKIESSELFIYPIGIWETIINFIKPKSIPTISNEIRKQFKFEGNKKLQSKLLSDYKFISNLLNEKIHHKFFFTGFKVFCFFIKRTPLGRTCIAIFIFPPKSTAVFIGV